MLASRVAQILFFADGKQVWVSSEIGGTVSVIDPATGEVLRKIAFEVPGIQPELLQPVGVRVTDDGSRVFVALGPLMGGRPELIFLNPLGGKGLP